MDRMLFYVGLGWGIAGYLIWLLFEKGMPTYVIYLS